MVKGSETDDGVYSFRFNPIALYISMDEEMLKASSFAETGSGNVNNV